MAIGLMGGGPVYGQMVVDAVMGIADSTDFVVLDDFQNFSQIDNSGNMVLDGDGVNENSGVINNTGSFGVGGDWTNLGTFNGTNGEFIILGSGNQTINNRDQGLGNLVVDGDGNKLLDNNTTADTVDFRFGIVTLAAGDSLIINGAALGGSDLSYLDGILYQRGTGMKFYPIGKGSTYAPVTLVDVMGINPLIGMEMFEPNTNSPTPDSTLIGVSPIRYWELTLVSGSFDSSVIVLPTINENLDRSALPNLNPINTNVEAAVVAEANDPSGPFTDIGVSTQLGDLIDGEITSERAARLRFFAIALAPRVPEEGVLFIPSAFAPSALNPEDQVFKIYGEKLSAENFRLRIFDKWGLLVFETDDFVEANTIGWNGQKNNTGAEMPTGVYTYTVDGQFDIGVTIDQVGTVILLR
ncbi:MAG: gliding motility-associated C-terminal domain-containing protein [Bacteroidetes bacterium]|nr:gliding motility-associated C-terminal domain-containing protein [Bacteroidota bacterium]